MCIIVFNQGHAARTLQKDYTSAVHEKKALTVGKRRQSTITIYEQKFVH